MKNKPIIIWMVLGLLAAGCGPATLDSARRTGQSTLTARELFETVAGNTLELQAYDFSAQVYFDRSGRLAAVDPAGQKDTGIWDIRNDDHLCLRFEIWYYGDIRCYSVTAGKRQGQLNFFTENGAAYYQAGLQPGDVAGLQATSRTTPESPTYLRQTLATEASSGQSSETAAEVSPAATVAGPVDSATAGRDRATAAVRKLAGDCPGCNLAGADLKEARLEGANLEGANLRGADLRYANLKRARLQNADLSGARLNHANLPGADLRGANLNRADFSGANLLLADLTGTSREGTTLTNAYLENTKGLEEQP